MSSFFQSSSRFPFENVISAKIRQSWPLSWFVDDVTEAFFSASVCDAVHFVRFEVFFLLNSGDVFFLLILGFLLENVVFKIRCNFSQDRMILDPWIWRFLGTPFSARVCVAVACDAIRRRHFEVFLFSDPQLDFPLETGFAAISVQDRVILGLNFEGFAEFRFPRACVSVSQPTCWSLRLTRLFQPPGVWISLFLWNWDVQQCNPCFPPENFTWLRRFDAILALKKRERWSERAAASRDFLTGFIVIRRVSSGFGPFSSFLCSSWTILSRWSRDCRYFSH